MVPSGLPGAMIAGVALACVLLRGSPVVGLLVAVPLLAAHLTDPAATALYGSAALVTGAVLTVLDHADALREQLTADILRLAMIAAMTVLGVVLARYRIARERRLTQVSRVAEVAQRAILMPVPSRVGPARVAVHYESAASDALIGGDLYALVPTPYGLRILVGDVRGKGLDAVRMSAQVLAAFRERASDNPDLGMLLWHLDRAVARACEDDEEFVTATVVQLTDDGQVTITAAGHPYPLALTGGRARQLQPAAPRPPLGLGGSISTSRLTLARGDRLLLYTDGLTEAREQHTRAFLSAQTILGALASGTDPDTALTTLREDVLAHSGGTLHDDIALVLIEYASTR